MAGSVNKVILVGNLGRDPEIRTTQGGKVANFSLATSESWTDKASGERREATEWHNIVIWNEAFVGIAERFLKKGSKIYVEGAMKTRKWTDQSGSEKFTTEVVLDRYRGQIAMLNSRADGESGGGDTGYGEQQPQQRATSTGRQQNARTGASVSQQAQDDDQIPF